MYRQPSYLLRRVGYFDSSVSSDSLGKTGVLMEQVATHDNLMNINRLDARSRLFEIIRKKSLVLGDIVLASGKHSDHYFDLKPTMLDPDGAELLSQLIVHRLQDIHVDFIGGLVVGAVPLLAPAAIESKKKGRSISGLIVRKAVKDHGTKKLVEGADDLTGKHVVVVDDVTTSGGSAMDAVDALRKLGANIVLVLSIVDREEGAAELYAKEGIPFQSLYTSRDFLRR